jgi:hypothetical protein
VSRKSLQSKTTGQTLASEVTCPVTNEGDSQI